MSTYNGWTNWETWNVALWVNNEYEIYTAMRRGAPHYTAISAEDFVRTYFPNGTPDMHPQSDEKDGGLDAVDWNAIAEDFNAE